MLLPNPQRLPFGPYMITSSRASGDRVSIEIAGGYAAAWAQPTRLLDADDRRRDRHLPTFRTGAMLFLQAWPTAMNGPSVHAPR